MSEPLRHEPLRAHLREQVRRCIHPPVDRFRHPWLSPMPPSPEGRRWLEARARGGTEALPGGDRFALGDYGLGLFHHDVSEAAIALAPEDEALAEACFGSLLCFLDCARLDGCVHRIELPHKARDPEPAKPVMAQLALRAVDGLGAEGLERAARHRVLPRLRAFLDYLERTHAGLHGLLLTPSARASGFDSDLLTAGLPERSVEGPDTNAFMVLEYRAAAELARRLGDDASAAELAARAERLRERMEALLWHEDERGGLYVALRWRHGAARWADELVGHRDPDGVVRPLESWTGLLPLYAGIPSPERAAALVRRLTDPAGFWGPAGVRTVPASSPFFHQAPRVMVYDPRRGRRGPVSNWTGPVWVLSNWYLARGLERYGYAREAAELDAKTLRLLADDLAETGALHECYDDRGRGLWPTRGTFLSWNLLALRIDG
jgi:putative isomerase